MTGLFAGGNGFSTALLAALSGALLLPFLWNRLCKYPWDPSTCPQYGRFFLLVTMTFLSLLIGLGARSASLPPGASGLGLPAHRIRVLEGTLRQDALYGQHGDIRLVVDVQKISDGKKRSGSAHTVLTVRLEGGREPYALLQNLLQGTRVVLRVAEFRDFSSANLLRWSEPRGLDGIRAFILQPLLAQDSVRSDSPGGALWFALLLGRQDLLDPRIKDSFYRSGCTHILALSGMHLSLLGTLMILLFGPLVGKNRAQVLALLAAGSFVFLAGPYPSVLRALGMVAVQTVCKRIRARTSLLSILSLSAPVCVLVCPALIQEPGFWLSCGALAGILLLAEPCGKILVPLLKPFLGENIAAGLAASIGASPFLLWYGLALYPQGIVASMILGPLSLLHLLVGFLSLVLGILGLGLSPLFPGAAQVMGDLGRFTLALIYDANLATASFFA